MTACCFGNSYVFLWSTTPQISQPTQLLWDPGNFGPKLLNSSKFWIRHNTVWHTGGQPSSIKAGHHWRNLLGSTNSGYQGRNPKTCNTPLPSSLVHLPWHHFSNIYPLPSPYLICSRISSQGIQGNIGYKRLSHSSFISI